MLYMQRTPFYGWLVELLGGEANGFALVPPTQFLVLGMATLILFGAVQYYGASARAALAVTLPIPFSNSALLFLNDVHPEILATSLVLVGLACLMALCRGAATLPAAVGLGLSLGAAYLMKPAFIMFIPVVPSMAILLLRLRGASWRQCCLPVSLVAVAVTLPFAIYAGLRYAETGSFQVVSYGGFQSSGMSGLMLRPETIAKLPREHRDRAAFIVEQRDALAAQGQMLPIPLNSQNVRSFPSAALGYFDVLARSNDNVLYDIVSGTRGRSESWVEFDQSLQAFTIAVVKAEPAYYAAWVIGATTRFVGLATVANATFAVASFALAGLFCLAVLCGRVTKAAGGAGSRDLAIVAVIVGGYTLANYLPSVLMTFPARRYVDTAALLLATFPLYALFGVWGRWFQPSHREPALKSHWSQVDLSELPPSAR
ncbi:MAG: hypothetical protein EA405_11525 [Rhodospirillales bacterium]|nr:MAG: hypothetical protein EA405_11525 [Rhodospirillales bacterium]